jgi:hypothetical protein
MVNNSPRITPRDSPTPHQREAARQGQAFVDQARVALQPHQNLEQLLAHLGQLVDPGAPLRLEQADVAPRLQGAQRPAPIGSWMSTAPA